MKYIIIFLIVGGLAILIITGTKYGWGEGVLWFTIGFIVLIGGGFLINRYLTRNK